MRLSVQGCLILLLCFSSSFVYSWELQTDVCRAVHWPDQVQPCSDTADTYLSQYIAANPDKEFRIIQPNVENYRAWFQIQWRPKQPSCNEPNFIHPDTGQCVSPQSPSECREVGELYDPATKLCATECPSGGSINGSCLLPPEPNQDCNKESPDYRGQVVLGYGRDPVNACGDFDQCSGDKPGQVGFVDGELRCISEDYGVPQCQKGSMNYIASMDEYGFACLPLTDLPESPLVPEDPNDDTTGDGQPDTYNPDIDPNINRKQLDQIASGQGEANQSLRNLEGLSKGSNDRLDGLKSELENNSKGVGEVVGFTRQAAENTRAIADALKEPEGGLNTDGLGTAPEFTVSVARLKGVIFDHPTIDLVTSIPSIGKTTTCPTWTFPANEFWSAHTMDIHCSIIDQYRSQLSTMFLFFWTIVAIFIFLRA